MAEIYHCPVRVRAEVHGFRSLFMREDLGFSMFLPTVEEKKKVIFPFLSFLKICLLAFMSPTSALCNEIICCNFVSKRQCSDSIKDILKLASKL